MTENDLHARLDNMLDENLQLISKNQALQSKLDLAIQTLNRLLVTTVNEPNVIREMYRLLERLRQ